MVGGTAGIVTLALVAVIYFRHRRRSHGTQAGFELSTSPAARDETVPSPFMLTGPTSALPPLRSKGGVYQRVEEPSRQHGAFMADTTTGLTIPRAYHSSVNDSVTAAESSSLSGLERRLATIIDVLANRPEVGGSPPRYAARNDALHGPGRGP